MITLKEEIIPQIPFKERFQTVLKSLTYKEMKEKMKFHVPSRTVKYNFDEDGALSREFEFTVEYDFSVDKRVHYKVSEDFAEYVKEKLEDASSYREAYDYAAETLKEDEPDFIWMMLSYFEDEYTDSDSFEAYCDETLKEYYEDEAYSEWRDMEAESRDRNNSYYW